MPDPVIFAISARWDAEASVWSGHCDGLPAAADAPTLDGLLGKFSTMALDLLPDNHPDVDPAALYVQIIALRKAATSCDLLAAQSSAVASVWDNPEDEIWNRA